MTGPSPGGAGRTAARGLLWNAGFQGATALLQLASTAILARVLAPSDFGLAAAVVGGLHLVNAFNCAAFMDQALQEPEGASPEWDRHWRAGMAIQALLAVLAAGAAGACLLAPTLERAAPLLLVAAAGVLIDAPSRLGSVMCLRDLDYRRLRVVGTLGAVACTALTIGLALAGAGPLALVIGGNVAPAIPFAVDLLLVRRWRPRGPWFGAPGFGSYGAALRFGLQQGAGNVLKALKGAAAGALLPSAIGFGGMGLLNRADALYASSAARAADLVGGTVYPLLPRAAGDPARFGRAARLYALAACLLLLTGGCFLLTASVGISRVLYGPAWAAADPLLPAAVIAGSLLGVCGVAYRVLLARTRLGACLAIDLLTGLSVAPALVLALSRRDPAAFAWSMAAASLVLAVVAAGLAMRDGLPGLLRGAVIPALGAGAAGAAASLGAARLLEGAGTPAILAAQVAAFSLAAVAVLRLAFPVPTAELLRALPMGEGVARGLGFEEPRP